MPFLPTVRKHIFKCDFHHSNDDFFQLFYLLLKVPVEKHADLAFTNSFELL